MSGILAATCCEEPGGPGPCCLPSGFCIEVLPKKTCLELGGVPFPPNVSCDDLTCLQACCLPDGSCEDLTTEQCAAAFGVPQGPETQCVDIDCGPIATCPEQVAFCEDGCPGTLAFTTDGFVELGAGGNPRFWSVTGTLEKRSSCEYLELTYVGSYGVQNYETGDGLFSAGVSCHPQTGACFQGDPGRVYRLSFRMGFGFGFISLAIGWHPLDTLCPVGVYPVCVLFVGGGADLFDFGGSFSIG